MPVREHYLQAIAELYVAEHNLHWRCGLCPDQDVGIVGAIVETGEFHRQAIGDRDGRQRVILILESPHIAEFNAPNGPAQGTTGRNIRDYLLHVRGLAGVGQFRLILMNPVQYQCSLGDLQEITRRVVLFNRIWELGGRQDFVDRLSSYFLPGDCVVNCCTGVDAPGVVALRQQVQEAAQQATRGQHVLRRFHPFTWMKPAQRDGEW